MAAPVCKSPGFSEAVVSVSDLQYWVDFFEETFQWEVTHTGTGGRVVHGLWHLPDTADIEDVVVREPAAQTKLGLFAS